MFWNTRRRFIKQATLAAGAVCAGGLASLAETVPSSSSSRADGVAPVDRQAIRRLTSAIRGKVMTPEDSGYEDARLIFNRAFDRPPAVIVGCAGASDVARALEFAQEHKLPLAVRAGGHSRLGYGMCDGGVVIDLSGMKHVEVDERRHIARAQAGALVRDLDQATQRFGLATTSGGCPTVGIAGFTLGGGEGRLMEKFGAACDNLLSAQLVTVDGRVIEASERSHPDLFWAIRGGGGNYGVVTQLEYRLHPVGEVLSGALTYAAGRLPELLQGFATFLRDAPDEMDAFAQLIPSEHGGKFKVDICYCGEVAVGVNLVRSLRGLKPADDAVRSMPYLEAQSAGGFLLAPVAHFQTNVILRQLSDDAIALMEKSIKDAPRKCKLIIVPLRGAVTRVSVEATAFALREPGFEVDITGVWNSESERRLAVDWVAATREALRPLSRGVYVNQLGDTSEELVRLSYGANYSRLVEIKKKYDPDNVLRLNQNIKPS